MRMPSGISKEIPGLSPGGRFFPFLPEDNQTWKADEVIRSLNDNLAQLLSLSAADFWATVRNDESLHVCLDTYLRYKRRAYDDVREEVEGSSAASQQLARRVFMVLLRLATPRERDPGGPTHEHQAQMLYDMWLLDMPKLMDVAVLYGTQNRELTSRFLSQVFELQPRYSDDLASSAPLLVDNLTEVVARCTAAGDKALKAGAAAAAAGGHMQELGDAVDYLRDATLTLAAFVACYPPAAAALLHPEHGLLLTTLALAHDRLLPQLSRVFGQQPAGGQGSGGAKAGGPSGAEKLGHLAVGVRRLAMLLLLYGICGAAPPMNGRPEPKPTAKVAEARGNELVALLMAVSSATAAAGGSSGGGGGGGFLGLLTREHQLDARVAAAVEGGVLALDGAQFDYLLALLGGDPGVMDRGLNQRRQANVAGTSTSSAAGGAGAGTIGAGSSGSGAGPSSSGAGPSDPAAAARRVSLISQIKDLLPDYGDGFLAACLESYGNNSEQVINLLLEGGLPPHLAKLDTQLATWGPPSQAAAGPSGSGSGPSGSGASSASNPPPDTVAAMSSWSSLAGLAASSAAAASSSAVAKSPGAYWGTGVGGGGGKMHRGTLKVLDRVDKEVKMLTSRIGEDLQWEYDDEYDDSFDDLAAGGADGVADAEGEDDGDERRRGLAVRNAVAGSSSGPSRLSAGAAPSRPAMAVPGGGADYDDEPNDASYSRRGPPTTTSTYGSASARSQRGLEPAASGAGRPPPAAAAAAAAAVSAATVAARGFPSGGSAPSSQGRAPAKRAPMFIGQGQSSGGGGGAPAGGRGAGPSGGRGAGGAQSAGGPAGPGGGGGGGGGRGGRGGRGGGGERLWVLDGKIYNYPKEGAQMVNSRQEADAELDAAKQAAMAIHGLGPGGNKGLMRQQQLAADSSDGSDDDGGGTGRPAGGGGRGGGGGGRAGDGGGGGGGDRRQHDRKEKNKAAVANHHRKDRALRKQGML